jgi:sirohydrochlorin ferrochelatase
MAKEEERNIGKYEGDLAVVLIGHGSNLPYNKEVLDELGKRIEKRGIYKAVKVAFMQLNSPSIEEVLRNFAQDDIKNIVAQPVFLAAGAHTTEDIPGKLKEAFEGAWEALGRDVRIIYGNPIGVDERIVDILVDRVNEAVEG